MLNLVATILYVNRIRNVAQTAVDMLVSNLAIASYARASVPMDTKKTTMDVEYAIVKKNQQVKIWPEFGYD